MSAALRRATAPAAWLWRSMDPADSLAEIVSGLTIVLVIVLTAGLFVEATDASPSLLLLIALASCIAAGISGAVLVVLEDLTNDQARRRSVGRLRTASSTEAGDLLDEALQELTGADLDEADAQRVAQLVRERAVPLPVTEPRVDGANLRAAAAAFVLNVLALLPVALPFLLIGDWQVALRVSNAIVLALLVAVGWAWGRVAGVSPIRCALVLLALGLLEVVASFVIEST